MVGEDRVMMSGKELRRVHVIREVMDKQITQVKAGALLGLTTRHVRRLVKRVQAEGEAGLTHRGRGQPSNRRIAEPIKAKVLRLYAQRYGDLGPTLAVEKLAERHGIVISVETLRSWLLEKGVMHFGDGSAHTDRGERGGLMWVSWCSSMGPTMTGWRAGAPAGC